MIILRKCVAVALMVAFPCSNFIISVHASQLDLPQPGQMVNLSPAFQPVLIKGLKVHPENPFRFDFILDTGNEMSSEAKRESNLAKEDHLKKESTKLIKYFLASLTVPEKDLWVNLSPYEKDRLIAPNLGETEMGRDMLAQDYLLKQLTASLIYPEKGLGKEFWNRLYAKIYEEYPDSRFTSSGSRLNEVSVGTFNKVWIVADKADVFERGNVAYVVGAHLKVMLEEDYNALKKNIPSPNVGRAREGASTLGSQVVREVVLPAIEQEVNTGKNFAPLRQMFYSMILASWYKTALKDAVLTQIYGNQSKVKVGVNQADPKANEEIFNRYIQAYKKGVFNYIKEDAVSGATQTIPRKYFSGGLNMLPDGAMSVRRLTAIPAGASLAMTGSNSTFLAGATVVPVQSKIEEWANFSEGHWGAIEDQYAKTRGQILDEFTKSGGANLHDFVRIRYPVAQSNSSEAMMSPEAIRKEMEGARHVAEALHTVLDPDSSFANRFREGGFEQIGYGVEAGAVNDGNFALGDEGNQGYFVNKTKIDGKSGQQFFVDGVNDRKLFFQRRARILGKPIRLVIKEGIGGQHTSFQGISEVFHVIDPEAGLILGEFELGKDWETYLTSIMKRYGITWDQIAFIPSSKSGSTDETMQVFIELFKLSLKNAANEKGLNGKLFAQSVFEYLHDINFDNGKELPNDKLFSRFKLSDLVQRINSNGVSLDNNAVINILGIVLGNMYFETTDRPKDSRLSAFIQNSGLGGILGENKPGADEMFDNVGGRWTADLHMQTFLAYYDLDALEYWESREAGIRSIRAETHVGNILGNKVVDENITNIILIVPDHLFWLGKGFEQNQNESNSQEGAPNLRTIRASHWKYQERHYQGENNLVINMTDESVSGKFKVFHINPIRMNKGKQFLAKELGRLFTTFYGMTFIIGTRLIDREIEKAGFRSEDIKVNDLSNGVTKVFQKYLFLRQPFVELGKRLLEGGFKQLQVVQIQWEKNGKVGNSPIEQRIDQMIEDAQNRKIETNISELRSQEFDAQSIAQNIKISIEAAKKSGRTFVPVIYVEGEKYAQLYDELMKLGIKWVLQGTGDQHINLDQILALEEHSAHPEKYFLYFVSFVPPKENIVPGQPAIGFTKGYLDNISPNLTRHQFGRSTFEAFLGQGGQAVFLSVLDTDVGRREILEHFKEGTKDLASLAETRGGIDFNRANMQLNRRKEGAGVEIKFNPAMVARIRRDGFDGLEFHIDTIIPITNLPMILGLRKEEYEGQDRLANSS